MKICVNVTFNQKYFDIEFSTTTALKSHCFIIKKKQKRGKGNSSGYCLLDFIFVKDDLTPS